jgi:hypothetical protein
VVYFENQATATASTQEATVTDQLDSNLDWSTFKLGEVEFDNQTVTDLAGKASGSVDVAQTSSTMKVRIVANVSKAGVATWYLRTVDPSTNDGWPADPYAGFLPPNDSTHRGEGHVTFTVNAKSGVAPGTKITNDASIVFDTNAPIATNEVFNTITDGKPGLATGPSPADNSTTATLAASLSWSAADLATTYNVYLWLDGDAAPATPTQSGRTSTFIDPGALTDGATYHWRVDSINDNGVTTGTTWTFTAEKVGLLQVDLLPAGAVSAGAKWRRSGTTTWLASGATESSVAIGGYTIEFKPVDGWTTPASQGATIANDQATTISATYVQQMGSLQVTLSPSDAVNAGAMWRRVGTETWLASGATESGVAVGSYTIEFKDVDGWTTPASQGATITNGQTTTTSATYVQQTGSIQVTLSPSDAVNAGAMWRRVGTETWLASGATESGVAVGDYTIEFKDVEDWKTPPKRVVTVGVNHLATLKAIYVNKNANVNDNSWAQYR